MDILFKSINTNLKNNIKLNNLIPILENYSDTDWQKYKKKNLKTYNRHTYKKNDLFELVVITWDKNQFTPIHSHPENGCLFKILEGSISENFYINDKFIKSNIYNTGNIQYIDNFIGTHSMINNFNNICVSLHIYAF